jgi:hypothetical protein
MYECETWGITLKREPRLGHLRTGNWGEHLDLTESNRRQIPLVNVSSFNTFRMGKKLCSLTSLETLVIMNVNFHHGLKMS